MEKTTQDKFTDCQRVLLANARQAMQAGNLTRALIWTKQVANAYGTDAKLCERHHVNELFAAIILDSTSRVMVASLSSGNILAGQSLNVQTILTACEELLAFARANERGIASLHAHVLLGHAGMVSQIHSAGEQGLSTSAAELEEYIEELGNVGESAKGFLSAGEDVALVVPRRRVKLAAKALTNARLCLSWFCSESCSDWDKAAAYCRLVKSRLLPGLEIYHVASASESIDTALSALEARDYRASSKAIAAAETTMVNYTWVHGEDEGKIELLD